MSETRVEYEVCRVTEDGTNFWGIELTPEAAIKVRDELNDRHRQWLFRAIKREITETVL